MDIEKLYQDYFLVVYKYILSISHDPLAAEEITQDTFFKALKKIDDFRGDSNIRVWLCQIAKNSYYAWYNASRKTEELDEELVSDTPDLAESLIRKELSAEAFSRLHELEEPYKEVFLLHVFANLSLKEISTLFGKSESWTRVTFFRARKKLKEKLR